MRKVTALAVLLFVVLGAQYLTWQKRSGVTVTSERIAGNPVERYVRPGQAPSGAVIVAHGFASNKRMLSHWGYYLAQQGFDTFLIDQPGHGESTRRLSAAGLEAGDLGRNLAAVVDQLIQEGRAQPGKIALVGHSMGGAAVTAAALADDRIKATVALSSSYDKPLPPDKPSNLLSLAAERDPPFMVEAVRTLAAQSNDGKGELGKQYGAFFNGSARESAIIDGRNHITILYDADVMLLTSQWIGVAFGSEIQPGGSPPWFWLAVALAGALGVVLAVGSLLAPANRGREPRPRPISLLVGLVTVALAAFSAVLASAYIRIPGLRLAALDYLVPYFLVMAAVLGLLRVLWPREFGFPIGAATQESLGDIGRSVGLFLGYIGAAGTIIHMNLSHYLPGVARIWPMLVMAISFWLYLVQEEGLKRAVGASRGPWASLLTGLVGKVTICITWLGAAALPNPQPFLPLAVPVVLAAMAGLELIGAILSRWQYSALSVATFTALVLSWSLAATLPLI